MLVPAAHQAKLSSLLPPDKLLQCFSLSNTNLRLIRWLIFVFFVIDASG
jgi:hypothetical protein